MDNKEEIIKKLTEIIKTQPVEETKKLLDTLFTTDDPRFFILADLWVEINPDDEFIKEMVKKRLNNNK